jgi:hypothetical protein
MAGFPDSLRLVVFVPLLAATIHAEPAAASVSSSPSDKQDRIHSPRLAAVLAESLPKYNAAKPAPATAGTLPQSVTDQPQNSIVRLPDFVVREKRPPGQTDLLTAKGWEADAAKRYLTPKGSLDRTLNAVTLTELWQSIPVLGRIPFVPFHSFNDGQRAQEIYGRVEAKRRWAEVLEVEETAQKLEKEKAGTAGSPKP